MFWSRAPASGLSPPDCPLNLTVPGERGRAPDTLSPPAPAAARSPPLLGAVLVNVPPPPPPSPEAGTTAPPPRRAPPGPPSGFLPAASSDGAYGIPPGGAAGARRPRGAPRTGGATEGALGEGRDLLAYVPPAARAGEGPGLTGGGYPEAPEPGRHILQRDGTVCVCPPCPSRELVLGQPPGISSLVAGVAPAAGTASPKAREHRASPARRTFKRPATRGC